MPLPLYVSPRGEVPLFVQDPPPKESEVPPSPSIPVLDQNEALQALFGLHQPKKGDSYEFVPLPHSLTMQSNDALTFTF